MIKVYEKKLTWVDSIQWNGDNYVEVTKFIVNYTKKPIQHFTHFGFDTFMIVFQNKEVRVVKNGDYIVIENDDVLAVSKDIFEEDYKYVGSRSEHVEGFTGLYKETKVDEVRVSTICAKDLLKVLREDDLLKARRENGITVCD